LPDHPDRQDFSEIAILTQNFDCTIHVDQNDRISDINEQIIRDLVFLSKHKGVRKAEQIEAKYALQHVVEHGVGTPTSCGYQFVSDRTADENVEIIQYFCCQGLGICYRIHTYWVHLFLAYSFSHYTTVAIIILNDKVYFGKYPGTTIFAWGKGRAKGSYYPVIDGIRSRRTL